MANIDQPTLFPGSEPQLFDADAFASRVIASAPEDAYTEKKIRDLRAAGLDVSDITDPIMERERARLAEETDAKQRHPAASGMPKSRGTLGMVEMPSPGNDNWDRSAEIEAGHSLTPAERERVSKGVAAASAVLKAVREK